MSKRLLLSWAIGRQTFTVDGEEFEHEGDPGTNVAHDLCHLVIAANGGLPWCPKGPDTTIRIAEFNAVLLEQLYHRMRLCETAGEPIEGLLGEAMVYAQDFVERHYAPFPISFGEARRRFLRAIKPELVARFYPTYIDASLSDEDARCPPFPRVVIRFEASSPPAWKTPAQQDLERIVREAKLHNKKFWIRSKESALHG